MRIGTYRSDRGLRVVVQTSRGYLDVGQALAVEGPLATDARALIAAEGETMDRLRHAAAQAEAGSFGAALHPADETRLAPPIVNPRRILCIGYNYRAHAAEDHAAVPSHPEVFVRVPSTLIGPRDDIALPLESDQYDLEVELMVVIGRGGRRISRDRALEAVFGYTVFNDVSVRDFQKRGSQWTAGKNFDRTGPCGPFVVTADELPDPSSLRLASAINEEAMQHGATRDLIFDVPTLLAELSTFTTLEPGDLIATGTPPGVGLGRTPPRWIRPGEMIHCMIDGIGELHNRAVPDGGMARIGA